MEPPSASTASCCPSTEGVMARRPLHGLSVSLRAFSHHAGSTYAPRIVPHTVFTKMGQAADPAQARHAHRRATSGSGLMHCVKHGATNSFRFGNSVAAGVTSCLPWLGVQPLAAASSAAACAVVREADDGKCQPRSHSVRPPIASRIEARESASYTGSYNSVQEAFAIHVAIRAIFCLHTMVMHTVHATFIPPAGSLPRLA